MVIESLKSHKALETDEITAELFIYGDRNLWKRIHHLIAFIWRQLEISNDQLVGIILLTTSRNNLRVYRTFQRDPECKRVVYVLLDLSLIHI